MSNYAVIKDNKVVDVLLFDNPTEEFLLNFSKDMGVDLIIPMLKGIGGIGDDYVGGFIKPKQPYDSWTWNSVTGIWEAPKPLPKDNKQYWWDEENKVWTLVYS